MASFRHLIANSTFVMPKGNVIVFAGPKGGVGLYTTTKEEEILALRDVAQMPTTQLEELVEVPVEGEPNKVVIDLNSTAKPQDPAITAAVTDAQESAVKAANPELTAKTADLGKLIAAAKTTK